MSAPLADGIRPQTLDDVVGQEHLLGKDRVLRRMVETGNIPNLIFYGPSGVGKTTVASIIAKQAGKKLYKLNGTTASTSDIRDVVNQLDTFDGMGGVILYLDEIQYLNKKQQQSLLEFIENGSITLIASTTENPYFYVYNAILSRCTVFEFQPIQPKDVLRAVQRAFQIAQESFSNPLQLEDGVQEKLAQTCGGDVRKAINAVEMLALASAGGTITMEDVSQVVQKSTMRYDRDGDAHYDVMSAFQKSIRGSDENAGLHYLARLLEAGDLISPCRRLLVIASEDIGLAYPQAASIVKSCVDTAMQLGLPEARIPLAQAVILLCTSPKSNSAVCAINEAMADVRDGKSGDIPAHLRDGHYSGAKKLGHAVDYQYAHNYPNHYVKQQYLPNALKNRRYYQFGANKIESAAKAYRDKIEREAQGK